MIKLSGWRNFSKIFILHDFFSYCFKVPRFASSVFDRVLDMILFINSVYMCVIWPIDKSDVSLLSGYNKELIACLGFLYNFNVVNSNIFLKMCLY